MNVCRSSCQTFPPSTSLLLPRDAGQLGAANHTIAILVKLLKGFDHIFCRHDTMNTERVPNGRGTIRVPLLYPELHGCGCGTHGITKTPYKVQVDHGSKRIQIFPATPWNWLLGFGVALSIKPSADCAMQQHEMEIKGCRFVWKKNAPWYTKIWCLVLNHLHSKGNFAGVLHFEINPKHA